MSSTFDILIFEFKIAEYLEVMYHLVTCFLLAYQVLLWCTSRCVGKDQVVPSNQTYDAQPLVVSNTSVEVNTQEYCQASSVPDPSDVVVSNLVPPSKVENNEILVETVSALLSSVASDPVEKLVEAKAFCSGDSDVKLELQKEVADQLDTAIVGKDASDFASAIGLIQTSGLDRVDNDPMKKKAAAKIVSDAVSPLGTDKGFVRKLAELDGLCDQIRNFHEIVENAVHLEIGLVAPTFDPRPIDEGFVPTKVETTEKVAKQVDSILLEIEIGEDLAVQVVDEIVAQVSATAIGSSVSFDLDMHPHDDADKVATQVDHMVLAEECISTIFPIAALDTKLCEIDRVSSVEIEDVVVHQVDHFMFEKEVPTTSSVLGSNFCDDHSAQELEVNATSFCPLIDNLIIEDNIPCLTAYTLPQSKDTLNAEINNFAPVASCIEEGFVSTPYIEAQSIRPLEEGGISYQALFKTDDVLVVGHAKAPEEQCGESTPQFSQSPLSVQVSANKLLVSVTADAAQEFHQCPIGFTRTVEGASDGAHQYGQGCEKLLALCDAVTLSKENSMATFTHFVSAVSSLDCIDNGLVALSNIGAQSVQTLNEGHSASQALLKVDSVLAVDDQEIAESSSGELTPRYSQFPLSTPVSSQQLLDALLLVGTDAAKEYADSQSVFTSITEKGNDAAQIISLHDPVERNLTTATVHKLTTSKDDSELNDANQNDAPTYNAVSAEENGARFSQTLEGHSASQVLLKVESVLAVDDQEIAEASSGDLTPRYSQSPLSTPVSSQQLFHALLLVDRDAVKELDERESTHINTTNAAGNDDAESGNRDQTQIEVHTPQNLSLRGMVSPVSQLFTDLASPLNTKIVLDNQVHSSSESVQSPIHVAFRTRLPRLAKTTALNRLQTYVKPKTIHSGRNNSSTDKPKIPLPTTFARAGSEASQKGSPKRLEEVVTKRSETRNLRPRVKEAASRGRRSNNSMEEKKPRWR